MKKICMVLVLCLAMMVAYGQADSKDTRIMVIKAIGVDEDIGGYLIPDSEYRAVTSIKAEVELKENGDPLLLKELVFSTKIIDGLGEKVYTIEGELLVDVGVMYPFSNYCTVRNVTWINLWFVVGVAKVKTTDIVIENFPYRNDSITLPNTHGQYVNLPVVVAVSPLGETLESAPWGGWAFAGVVTSSDPFKTFGGITWLRQFVEQWAR